MDEPTENNSLKIVIVGEAGVGKTSIISQFIDKFFDDELQASTGASFSAKVLSFDNGKSVKIELWDTAGQERYRSLTKIFFQNSSAVVFVYDITREDSFEEIKNYWLKQIKESAPDDIIKALVANKYDLIDKEKVNEEEARKMAEENNALFYLTSAKSSVGVKELFCGLVFKIMGWENTVKLIENDTDNSSETEKSDGFTSQKRKDTILLDSESLKPKTEKKKKGCC
jgi:Ras-related protein Rab-5C